MANIPHVPALEIECHREDIGISIHHNCLDIDRQPASYRKTCGLLAGQGRVDAHDDSAAVDCSAAADINGMSGSALGIDIDQQHGS